MRLEINIRDDTKLVEIWLTNGEKDDEGLQRRLKPLYQTCQKRGYLAAVFQSGGEDLTALTGALLTSNRRRMAERAARQDGQQPMELAR